MHEKRSSENETLPYNLPYITPEGHTVSPQVSDSIGRGGAIRTPDPLRPRQVRYQAALRPDIYWSLHSKPLPHVAVLPGISNRG